MAARPGLHPRTARAARAARIRRTGYRLASYGETLAYNCGSHDLAPGILARYMTSALHRGHLLNPALRDIGVGGTTWTPSGCAGATFTVVIARRTG